MASCHYAKKVLEWYESEGVDFVPKDYNPPNSPEIRPIEKYWANIEKSLLLSKKRIKSLDRMRREWTRACALVTKDVQRLMHGIKTQVRLRIRGESLK